VIKSEKESDEVMFGGWSCSEESVWWL